jgi:hypothetical protein
MSNVGDGWVGFDLDGTLAHYDGWKGIDHVGKPVEGMARRLRELLARGVECRIFTARVGRNFDDREIAAEHIQDWTENHFGVRLAVTCEKDFAMIALYDDRAVAVACNLGVVLGGEEP